MLFKVSDICKLFVANLDLEVGVHQQIWSEVLFIDKKG